MRVALLKHLNLMYARNADGTQGGGLPISFCYHEPVGYVRAAPGSWLSGRSDRFSVMALAHGTRQNVVGTAFADGTDNGMHENDSPSPGGGELGVFANQFVAMFNLTYNNYELTERPISAEDVPRSRRSSTVSAPRAGARPPSRWPSTGSAARSPPWPRTRSATASACSTPRPRSRARS